MSPVVWKREQLRGTNAPWPFRLDQRSSLAEKFVLESLLVDQESLCDKGRYKDRPATYFAISLSTFPTRAVNEGRPSEPGAGWMTSAPRNGALIKCEGLTDKAAHP